MAPAPLPKLKRPATHDHLEGKPPPWRIVDVCQDPEAADDLAKAELALDQAELAAKSKEATAEHAKAVEDARRAVESARAAFEAASHQMLFVAIGSRRYDELLTEHPQVTEDDEQPHANGQGETEKPVPFHVALVAASCRIPEMTVEQALYYSQKWNAAEFSLLYQAALGVNGQSRMVQLGKGSSWTRG